MSNLTVPQKFAKLMLTLREIRPFYSCIYEVMEKIEYPGLGTVAVTTNTMLYDVEFIEKTEFSELIFIFLHEIAHISLMHVARRENRDINLWNVACDLYVNSLLIREFEFNTPGTTSNINGFKVTVPKDLMYCSTLDIDNEFVEEIYSRLEEQAKLNGYLQARLSSLISGKKYKFSYTGTEKTNKKNNNKISLTDTHETFETEIDPSNVKNDLIDDGKDQSVKNQESHKIVSDAVVRVEMGSQYIGTDSDSLKIKSKKLLKSEVDWRKLLRKYLVHATTKDSSFNVPDKRMYYQKAIYPGQSSNEEKQISGIKICIDTSGSISEKDMKYFCGQVYEITKQFNIDAELIYWDASVQSVGQFNGYKEFERVECYGRGGTAPEVVFEYFESKNCKVKPVVTLMFTDGHFYGDWHTNKMAKKYKDTIWVMTKEHNKYFEPPFGKKTIAKFK